jgi:hypothetical protein
MNCNECNGSYQVKNEPLEISDPYVGPIVIVGILYYQCDKCGDLLFTKEMAQAIEHERNRRIQDFLQQLPLKDFISSAETARVLGISRQALHKHRRISHGFIYKTKFAGITVFHKYSALMFKKAGDGRFPLHFTITYSEPLFTTKESPYDRPLVLVKTRKSQSYNTRVESVKENIYGN